MNARIKALFVAVFDYRSFVVAGGFLALALLGYVVWTFSSAAHDQQIQNLAQRKAATRRIDLLTQQNARQQEAIAQGTEERGELAAKLDAVVSQVEQLGGTPVATRETARRTSEPTASPAARPRASSSPAPRPTRTPAPRPTPAPTPTPSPTCNPPISFIPICG